MVKEFAGSEVTGFNGDVKDKSVSDRTDTSEELGSDTNPVFDDNFR